MKVQFCSGGSKIPGFINLDIDCDIKRPLPYPNEYFTEARCEHGAEHQNSHQALRFFQEVYRILEPGGSFRVCCPVLERLSPEEVVDIILNHTHEVAFSTQSLKDYLRGAGFRAENIKEVGRDQYDHHWTVIGKEKDDRETARILAIK